MQNREPITHKLKCVSPFFDDIWRHRKLFDIRKNDRDYQVNDNLEIWHFDPETQTYPGRSITAKIGYILSDPEYVKKGFVIIQLRDIKLAKTFWKIENQTPPVIKEKSD